MTEQIISFLSWNLVSLLHYLELQGLADFWQLKQLWYWAKH